MKAEEYLEVALGGNMNFGTLKPLAITEIMEEYKNKCVVEKLEKLEVKHRMSLDYNLIGEIGDIIKELKQ